MNPFVISANSANSFVNELNSYLTTSSPTLCIGYTDALLDFKAVASHLKSLNIDLIGVTTCGEIYNDEVVEGTFTALFLEIDKSDYKIYTTSFDEDAFEASTKLSNFAAISYSNPGILVYVSGIGTSGDAIVKGIKSQLAAHTPIFGGLAADSLKLLKYTVFTNTIFEDDGLAAVVFDTDKIEIGGRSFGGYTEIGKIHTATKAKENIIYEIDNILAYDLFEQYFGEQEYLISEQINNENEELEFVELAGAFPLKLIDDDKEIFIRSPLYFNKKDKSIILAGDMPQGSKFRFCGAPDLETSKQTIDYFTNLSKNLNEVDCIILNNCVGRRMSFGPMFDEEISQLYEIWKVPTVGYLALGEIGNGSKANECSFHNVTISLTTLKQKAI